MNSIILIPQPSSVITEKSALSLRNAPHISGSAVFSAEMALFREQMKATGLAPESGRSVSVSCVEKADLPQEGYEMSIRESGIELRASSGTGMHHAFQSLRQLLLSAKETGSVDIPCAEIADAPRFSWRGCMLDTSRHFYTTAFIKKLIDLASLHHLNVFHWHLTDDQGWRLPVDAWPGLTETGAWRIDRRTTWDNLKVGGFYSKEDIREIVAFAAERHVEVVPEVDLPGHASAILAAYPDLGCTGGPYRVEDRFGIFEDVLCAGNDRVFDLFADIFDTLKELFPSPYVHIGGDEVKFNRWEECPKCRKRMEELKLDRANELQSWITVRLANMLKERGKTAIGWDEVLEGTEKLGLPQDLIVMSWRGQEGGIAASAKGHRVIMTPLTDGCYVNFKPLDNPEEPGHLEASTVAKSYRMDPVTPKMSEAQAKLVLGGQCNLWSEVIYASRIAEYMLFPRLSAISESLWSPKAARSLESFVTRLPELRKRLDALDVCQFRGPIE
jgi:hexosaminidase